MAGGLPAAFATLAVFAAEGLDRRCATPNNDEIHSHLLPGSVTPPAWLTEEVRHFAMRKAVEVAQIYPVFRDLFKKEGAVS